MIPSTLDCAEHDDKILVARSSLKFIQQIVAVDRFYGAEHGHCDTVLVIKIELSKTQLSNTKKYSCWFAKALQLV